MSDVEAVGEEPTDGYCTKEDCLANKGGACLLEHDDPSHECPEWQLDPQGGDDGEEPPELEPDYVLLPSGEALRPGELERILARHRTSIVVPLGGVGAGKTTLIALMHQLLCVRELPGWKFAGSITSVGFMRRNFYASLRANTNDPATPRTPLEQSGHYLHIDARSAKTDRLHPVLLSDIAGESVAGANFPNNLMNGNVPPEIAAAVARADHVPIVVGGAELANPQTRNHGLLRARTLMQMVGTNLQRRGRLSMVVTQYDLLVDYDLDELKYDLTQGTITEGAPFFLTAACAPKAAHLNPTVKRGTGVAEFFTFIATADEETPQADPPPPPTPHPLIKQMWRRA